MRILPIHVGASVIGFFGCLLFALNTLAYSDPGLLPAASPYATIPPIAPSLQNIDFECASAGYYTQTNSAGNVIHIPNKWTLVTPVGAPKVHSARINFARSCDGSAHVERISGEDSVLVEAQDLERPPTPGKPFDIALYQQVSATVGGAYSLSGWMLSLCGGSNVPNDCPANYYMAKQLGIDPTGGTDPLAASVVWTENQRNFIENGQRVGWSNLRMSAVAQAVTITVFARINSPFQWHGNHAFIDALSLVRAPIANLTLPMTMTGSTIPVQWDGEQSPDLTGIPGGKYGLLFDIQYRHTPAADWTDFVRDAVGAGSASFQARCATPFYEFRIRARAEQPDGQGVGPNQRYPGVWSEPISVFIPTPPVDPNLPSGPHNLFLPLVQTNATC